MIRFARSLLNVTVALTFGSSALAAPANGPQVLATGYRSLSKAQIEGLLTKGLSGLDAKIALAARFRSAADQKYLKAWGRQIKDDERLVMRGYTPISEGYRVTAPNGREFTLKNSHGKFLINDHAIAANTKIGAQRYLASVHQALKSTFVVRQTLPWFSLLPRAEAGTPIEYGLLAALGAVIAYGGWQALPGATKEVRRVELSDFLMQAEEECQIERKENRPFAESQTLQLMSLMISEQMLSVDLQKNSIDCSPDVSVSPKLIKQKDLAFNTHLFFGLCPNVKGLIKCFDEYRGKTEIAPIKASIKSPSDGATPASSGSSTTGQ